MTTVTKVARTFTVERATPQDRQALVEMYESFEPKGEAFGLPPRKDPGRWLDSLAPYPNFLIRMEGRVVGHGVLCVEGEKGETAIFVHQDYRRHGVGRSLLEALIAEGRRLGLKRVWGMMDLANVVMLRLAESVGFTPATEQGILHMDL